GRSDRTREPIPVGQDRARAGPASDPVYAQLLRAADRPDGLVDQVHEIRPFELELEAAADHLQRVPEIVDQQRLALQIAAQHLDRLQDLAGLRGFQLDETERHQAGVQRGPHVMDDRRREGFFVNLRHVLYLSRGYPAIRRDG